jgi:hypothetical protein
MKAYELLAKLYKIPNLRIENPRPKKDPGKYYYFGYPVEIQKDEDEDGNIHYAFNVEESRNGYSPITNDEVRIYGKKKNIVVFINDETKEEIHVKFSRIIVKPIDLIEL